MRVRLVREMPFLVGVALGLAVLPAFGFVERRAELLRVTDFSGFWAGARALASGLDPYDPERWRGITESFGTQTPDTAVYGYPPHVAVLLLPLASLPLESAAALWAVGGMIVAALGIRTLLRTALPNAPIAHTLAGLALFASQPALTGFVIGQWNFVLVGALAFAASAALRGHAIAGVATAALLAKPQLALAAPVAILLALRRGRAQAAAAMAAATLVAIGAGWLAAPGWLAPWLAAVPARRVDPLPRNATTFGAMADLLGTAGLAVAAMLVVAGALVLLRWADRPAAAQAAVLAFGHVVAPYSWGYDQLLLLVPAIAAGAALPRRSGAALAIGVSATLLFVSPLFYALSVSRGRESLSGLIPVLVFAAMTWVLWDAPRALTFSASRTPSIRGRNDMAKELSVTLEDKPGTLATLSEALGKAGVNISAFAVVPGPRGNCRLVVEDAAAARKAIEGAGLTVDREREALVVDLEDKPGALGRVARKLANAQINVEAAYVAGEGPGGKKVVVITADAEKAKGLL